MPKKQIDIRLPVNRADVDTLWQGGELPATVYGERYQSAIESMLNDSFTDYCTRVRIDVCDTDIVVNSDVTGLDMSDPMDVEVRDFIVSRLNDDWFMCVAWETARF